MSFQQAIIFHPKKLHKDYVFNSAHPFAEYFFDFSIADNQFLINVVHLKSLQPKGLVFFLHGTFRHIQFAMSRVDDFLINNYDVVIMDYPQYG